MPSRISVVNDPVPHPVAVADPLWFKDAVIYQLHVRSFHDSTGDGIGDFGGLTQKLDYIQELGVTVIWLLPFFPSPLRDDGYDTSDYCDVNPLYGTLRDFQKFLDEAHRRDLRVITEMVMNHTSDQHAWFQRARRAKPGSKWRNYYVWSDTANKYPDARIIFQDFEGSNWTWDPIAQAYYWHRFYHHQPDLNFDSPDVRREMFRAVDFWLALGVDGFRLDAIPYLFERDGTNCENLPETHQFLRDLRKHVDARFPARVLLAEANQWPEDAAAYFGQGDECHLNFHFPLMPRMFMAIEREDRYPIHDILEQTPPIPDGCQWATFLRNHDELTLEMVTDEERDYMYRAYARDAQARVNLGIRRRLAPLLRNNRRKIELMNALLLSLPGTPVLYYGDELGMGDNIFLGDRNGVRTPMQWSADRNGGFSQANPQQLFLPVNIDPEYHFASLNVEVEQMSPHSLLWWMRRIISLRRQFTAFGRGRLEFLTPENPKVLAFLRQTPEETLLVVANLSRFAQHAELDLSRFRGQTPIELFGHARFPPIGELPYFITLGPHGFYWFRLIWPAAEVGSLGVELPTCSVEDDWDHLFQGQALRILERSLPDFLRRQRWFAGGARTIQEANLLDTFELDPGATGSPMRLLLVRVRYVEGEPDLYLIPVVFAPEEQARNILGDHPRGGVVRVARRDGAPGATLCEAIWEQPLWRPLLELLSRRRKLRGRNGELVAEHSKAFRQIASPENASISVQDLDLGNTTVLVDGLSTFKLFRRLMPGINPEWELGRYLTEHTQLTCIPRALGCLAYQPMPSLPGAAPTPDSRESMTVGVLHEFVVNQGDAWTGSLDELGRYLERLASHATVCDPNSEWLRTHERLIALVDETPPPAVQQAMGQSLNWAELLGCRTAELHSALARGETSAFQSEPFGRLYQRSLYQSLRVNALQTLRLLRGDLAFLDESARQLAERVQHAQPGILAKYRELLAESIPAARIRCHGDLHLGQVLFTGKDFVFIDFEGESSRPVSERRIKVSPLRDVAGMIWSFHQAAYEMLREEAPHACGPEPVADTIECWLKNWYLWSAATFLKSYLSVPLVRQLLPPDRRQLQLLLDAYLLERALHELHRDWTHRPDRVPLTLLGISRFTGNLTL